MVNQTRSTTEIARQSKRGVIEGFDANFRRSRRLACQDAGEKAGEDRSSEFGAVVLRVDVTGSWMLILNSTKEYKASWE
jgi:hypothetical protein